MKIEEIDIVVTWVDCQDPKWKKDLLYYKNKVTSEVLGAEDVRFQDWENLVYWFRCIEKFAPWARKIHLVTEGHIPSWLNLAHPKLNVVRHSDYIPANCLPVFNSHPIENNLHRIEALAEKFILFNDDFFLTKETKATDFFKRNLPCDMFTLNAHQGGGISTIIMNNLALINRKFSQRDVLKGQIRKWFRFSYKSYLIRTFLLLPWPKFTGFFDPHLPQPFLKSTFVNVWSEFSEELTMTNKSKFRLDSDLNQYLFRYWQLCVGSFYPMNMNDLGRLYLVNNENLDDICEDIERQKFKCMAINDTAATDFERAKLKINNSLMKMVPAKSDFEK